LFTLLDKSRTGNLNLAEFRNLIYLAGAACPTGLKTRQAARAIPTLPTSCTHHAYFGHSPLLVTLLFWPLSSFGHSPLLIILFFWPLSSFGHSPHFINSFFWPFPMMWPFPIIWPFHIIWSFPIIWPFSSFGHSPFGRRAARSRGHLLLVRRHRFRPVGRD
jgi:hypothetical protein